MNIVGITMITRPDYRQDPWHEAIRQSLELCDHVVVIYGDPADDELIRHHFGKDVRVTAAYLHWPQPEWTYDELACHLNYGLDLAKELNADWVYKFDSDYFIHEDYVSDIRLALAEASARDFMLCSIEKRQLFLVDRYYQKGKIPIFLNMKFPLVYGKDETRYTDLCQPILNYQGKMIKLNKAKYMIPEGSPIPAERVMKLPGAIYNYDYSFKTKARAMELLYHFDRSHASFWSFGYSGKKFDEITPQTAFDEYMALVKGRLTNENKPQKMMALTDHPKHIIERIKSITPEHMGYNLWGLL